MALADVDKRLLYAGAIAVEALVLTVLYLVGRYFSAL